MIPASDTSPSLKRWLATAFVLLLLIFTGYKNTIDAPFTFDDEVVVKQNPAVKDLNYFLQIDDLRYRHLFYLTFSLNYAIGQEDPSGYRLVNLGLHMGNSLLVLVIAHLTILWGMGQIKKHAYPIACLTALAFALHPVQSEAVTYISGRSSSLMAFFYLCAVLCYILSGRKQISMGWRAFGYVSTLLFSAFAILSKETAVTLPAVLLLYDLCFMRQGNFAPIKNRLLTFYLPFPLLALAMVTLSSSLQGTVLHWLGKINPAYALQQVNVLAYSLRLILFPINQSFDHEFPQASYSTDALRVATTFLLIGGLTWVLVKLRKNNPVITFGLGAYLLILSPTNSILPRMDLLSERNLYLPSFGLFFILACGIIKIADLSNQNWKKYLITFSQIILGVCLLTLLMHRNGVYASNIILWEDVLAKAPGKARAYHNLSHFYLEEKNYDQAFIMLKKLAASRASPYYKSYAHTNLGNLYVKYGDMKEAEQSFTAAARIYPEMPSGHFNLGILFATRKDFPKALTAFNRAEEAQKAYTEAHVLPTTFYLYRARVHLEMRQYPESEQDIQTFLRNSPKNPDGWLILAQIREQQGQIDKAIEVYENNVWPFGQPWHKAEAMRASGHLRKTLGQLEKAAEAFAKAIKVQPDMMEAHIELGKLLWVIGKNTEGAAIHLKHALKLGPSTTQTLEIENLLTKIESGSTD